MARQLSAYTALLLMLLVTASAQTKKQTAPYKPTADELRQIQAKTDELAAALQKIKLDDPLRADVEVYHKAAVWIVRYANEEFYSKRYLTDTLTVLDHGLVRAKELAAGKPSWPTQKGQLVRAYQSRVDGSVQPYAVTVPENPDGRLDVVLHGRGATLNEVNFIASHERPGENSPHMRLDVYGRGNNAYRWAGETDVFEAIESVKARYKIDSRRIVLRGFSMGGAGAWHLGLHHPDMWAAVEAGAGFTETKRYAKLDSIPPYQDATLHIYDATDYALNAVNVPFVGYGGEDDGQLQGSTNIREALTKEGFHFTSDGLNWITKELPALFLVGPKTGHKFHPDSKKRSDEFIQSVLPQKTPRNVRFITYTTRYNRCFGIEVLALEKPYQRAEVELRDGALKTHNVAQLKIDGKEVLPAKPGIWKTHGLQGPIDDAFMDSFLCVKSTGAPAPRLEEFRRDFAKWMRGDVRVKDDAAVTPSDIANHNLILFGAPASNKLIGQIAGKLPIRWTKDAITVGDKTFSAAEHTLVMIYPNPLNPRRYVVLNSGHTFGEKEFRGTNALLFPRLGDYAVLRSDGTVALAGLFNEHWELER